MDDKSSAAKPELRAGVNKRLIACVCAACLLCISTFALATWLLNQWQLRTLGSQYRPMALLTAVAFTILCIGLLTSRGLNQWPLRLFAGEGLSKRFPGFYGGVLLAVLLCSLGTITFVGFRQIKNMEVALLEDAKNKLDAIADLKSKQLAQWRRERMANANLVRGTPYAARRALDFLRNPNSLSTQKTFENWLDTLLSIGAYDQAVLLNTNLDVCLEHPNRHSGPLCKSVMQSANEAMRTRKVVFADLHESDTGSFVHMDMLIPLVVRREGTNVNVPAAGMEPLPGDYSAGLILLKINPEYFLFPFLDFWPVQSSSAETLLIRREGDYCVYLNNLRHRRNTAMTLRMPLTQTNIPAVRAVKWNQTGILAGTDYRGMAVLASARRIPDSPWFIVAKMDMEEMTGSLKQQARNTMTVSLALMLVAAISVAYLWNRRRLQFAGEQLLLERGQKELAQRIVYLSKHANDIILLTDQDWNILEANDRALSTYGYSLDEVNRLSLRDLRAIHSRDAFDRRENMPNDNEGAIYETTHQRKDGSVFPVESSTRKVILDKKTYHQVILRDITERKQAENELKQALEQKTALLKEVHHRVKNNLAIMTSLLNLQASQIKTPEALAAVRDAQDRLAAMAQLHETLYSSGQLDRVEFDKYLRHICSHLERSLGTAAKGIKITLSIPPVLIGIDQAVPCGLIVNELITNSVKHAFPGEQKGEVHIGLLESGDNCVTLQIRDNGCGIPSDLNIQTTRSLGLTLVSLMSKQLKGTLTYEQNNGTNCEIHFTIK